MSPDNKKSIYQEEYKKLEAAEKALQSLSDTSNPVHPHFEELYLSYKKLLRQSVQLVSIADRQQERLLNLQNDIAAKNRELEALSITDSLTGIPNRRRFDEVLMQEYARLNRTGAELYLIMVMSKVTPAYR
jgi:GGDEF domain-containing protein